MSSYDDIIHLPHHVSRSHPKMSPLARAAQFAPFAALTGYEAITAETARQTECRQELDECQRELLDQRLQELRRRLSEHPAVRVRYFLPDPYKDGGAYQELSARVTALSMSRRTISFDSGECIDILSIVALELSDLNP